jgi:hypothetical protein
VLLVLSRQEFGAIPPPLRVLVKWGLEIVWTSDNLRSYKKLLPAREKYPNATIITADDDVIYPRWWLRRLMEAHVARPTHILAYRANEIRLGPDGEPLPYLQWTHPTLATPSYLIFPTGVGGVLYPPRSLPALAGDGQLAMKLCPTADDVWFRVMALRAGTPVGVVDNHFHEFVAVRGTQAFGLQTTNVGGAQNDTQLARCLEHFGLAHVFADVGQS